jgi:Mn2+/Fe2+ NRAMP family transporter
MKSWRFRAVWMFVLLLGVVFSSSGINPIELIQFAQIANGAMLPVVVGIMLWIMNRKGVLGENINTLFQNLAGFTIFALTILLALRTFILVLRSS